MSHLIEAAGIAIERPPVEAVGDDVAAALVAEAVRFLRCGTLSLAEWRSLEPVEKRAFTEAAETVLAERAAAHGYAAQSEVHAKSVAARSDDGAALKDALVRRALDGLVAKAQGETQPADGAP